MSAAAPPVNKPRLIAKTGASLANLQKSRSGSVGASGPDASKVWNKNRPVQPPPPRQFTDEELKQQYGIHLATRLQSDEGGKESKWADIDDDEDDWAPETVVWMDGTKSTLTAQEPTPPPKDQPQEHKEQKPAGLPQTAKPADGVRPTLSLKQRSGDSTMRILKPGQGLPASAKQEGLTAGSPGPDKAGSKSKSPAPAPAKSPWAPVPKVESFSPVNPPTQQAPPSRPMASQDLRSYDPVPPPTREIAADTFDRSWKEGEGGARELFNSTNGRYEPAPEGRRSSRPESSFRKPAVLQRQGPAEPSAAFQSRTTAPMDGSWGRRRGSSVSQGSMPPHRRMSMNQRPDLAATSEIPNDTHPQDSRGEPGKPTFAQQSAWDQQMPPRPEPDSESAAPAGPPGEDPVKVQERVMREKRELAKKRRQEEEAAAEAEKQERLKAKLAALSGAGKSKKEREAEAAAAAAAAKDKEGEATKETTTSENAAAQHVQAPAQQQSQPEPAKPAETSANTAPSLEAQSLPPAPEKPQPLPEKLPSPLPPKPLPAGLPDRSISDQQSQRQAPRAHLSPRATARAPYQQPSGSYKTPASSYSSPGDRKPQPSFGRSPNLGGDTFSTPWPTTAPNSNVWGTSGIGNGTFESSSAFAPMPMAQQNSALPPPPGMARSTGSARISPQGFGQETRSPSLQQSQMSEQQRAFPPPGMDSRPEPFSSQPRLNGVSPAPGAGRPVHPPGPIGPPSRTQQQPAAQSSLQGPGSITAWNNAANTLPTQFSREVAAQDERRRQQVDAPVKPSENRYKETFKKTSSSSGVLGGPRKYEKTEYTVHDAQGSRQVSTHSPAPPATQTQPTAPFATPSPVDKWRRPGENTVRMPDPSQNPAHLPQQPPIAPPHLRNALAQQQSNMRSTAAPVAPIIDSKDQSPPPPETEDHPVNDGTNRPQVKLPKPAVKVRLPPSSSPNQVHVPPQSHGAVMMPQRPWSNSNPPGAARPIIHDAAWQARFNGLFNRTPIQTEIPPSPPKTPPKMQAQALAVASSSRVAMDEQARGATVALPQAKKRLNEFGLTIDNSSDRFSKPIIDEMFKQEQSFGSTPIVRIPRNTQYDSAAYTATTKNMLTMPTNSRFVKQVDSETSREPYFWRNPEGIFVTIPQTRFDNKLIKHSSAGMRGPRKPHGRNNSFQERNQERKASGKFIKNKNGKDDNTTEAPATASEGGRKSGYQRPTRQNSNGPAKEDNGGAKEQGNGRKQGWAKTRGPRSEKVTAASPTPVKSN